MILFEAIRKFCEYNNFAVQKNTNNSYSFVLRSFCLYLRNPLVQSITIEDVLRWYGDMETLGWDMSAIHTKAVCIRQLFLYCRKVGMKTLNPDLIPVPGLKKKAPRVASEEKYRKLLDSIPIGPVHERNRALIMLYHDTGARNSEVLSLNVSDLDLKKCRAIIRTEKAKKLPFREIFWSNETNDQLRKWLRLRAKFTTNDVVFINMNKSNCGDRLGNRGVVKFLSEYSERAGMETVNAHSFRHLFGVKYAKGGANNSVISSLMGHSSMESSQVYTTLYGEDLAQVWRKYG